MKQIYNTIYAPNKDKSVQEWSVFVEDDTTIVKYGKWGGKLQTKKTVCEAKNANRSNATTPEQQAVLEAESKYRDQIRKGYVENVEDVLLCQMKNGIEFRCKMKGTHEERLYNEQLKLVGKHVTFTYQQLSVDRVPIFPVGVAVRELDLNWEPQE